MRVTVVTTTNVQPGDHLLMTRSTYPDPGSAAAVNPVRVTRVERHEFKPVVRVFTEDGWPWVDGHPDDPVVVLR